MLFRSHCAAAAFSALLLIAPAAAQPVAELHLFFAEAILKAKPGQADALLAQLQAIQRGTRAESGNLAYDIHRSVDDPLMFVVFEAFADRAAFDAHVKAPHTRAFSEIGAFQTLAKPDFDRIFMSAVGPTVWDHPELEGQAMAAQRERWVAP
jgi:quinol monooxygenase YgiN